MTGETPGSDGGQGNKVPQPYEPIFAIFQGGGAKGITHIGALKAIEDEHMALVGVAGTSAGAIVAALAAVGYSADELLDPKESGGDILRTLGHTPVGILKWRRWRWLVLARLSILPVIILIGTATFVLLIGALARVPLLLTIGAWGVLIPTIIVLLMAIGPFRRRGVFSSEDLQNVLNEAFRRKLAQHYEDLGKLEEVPDVVRFKHIDPGEVARCSPLKVIVSDIRSGELVLFDGDDREVIVAQAVAASAAIPFAFAPPRIEGTDKARIYADGGLVSNLPAWSFSVEKRAFERARDGKTVPVLAFSLKNPKAAARGMSGKPQPLSLMGYLSRVFQTGIFGSQRIVDEFVPDLDHIELKTPLDTMAFNLTRKQAVEAYKAGLASATAALRRRRLTQKLIDGQMKALLATVRIQVARRRKKAGAPMPHLRLTLVDPTGPKRRPDAEFRVVASIGMSPDHADDRLPLDPRNLAAPKAFADRQAILAVIKDQPADLLWMSKYERALIWPQLCSIVCIPVFGAAVLTGERPPRPQRVLCLDSSDSLQEEFKDPRFMKMLHDRSLALSPAMIRKAFR